MPHNLVNAVFWCTRQFDPRCGPATPSHFQAHQRVFPAHACNTTAGTEFAQSMDGGHRMGRAVAVAGLTLWLMPLPGHVPNVASAAGQQPVRSPTARVLILSDQARRFLLLQYRGFPTEFMGCMIGEVQGRSEEHTSELQSRLHLVCRLLLEKKKNKIINHKTRKSNITQLQQQDT